MSKEESATIMVQTPLIALINRSGMAFQDYLKLLQNGSLDDPQKKGCFNSTTSRVMIKRTLHGMDIPDILPNMKGTVTWRKAQSAWSLDAAPARLCERILYWSSAMKGIAKIRIAGEVLPDIVMQRMNGGRLVDYVSHACLLDEGIIIKGVTSYPPVHNPVLNVATPGSVEIHIDAPVEHHTYRPDTPKPPRREENANV